MFFSSKESELIYDVFCNSYSIEDVKVISRYLNIKPSRWFIYQASLYKNVKKFIDVVSKKNMLGELIQLLKDNEKYYRDNDDFKKMLDILSDKSQIVDDVVADKDNELVCELIDRYSPEDIYTFCRMSEIILDDNMKNDMSSYEIWLSFIEEFGEEEFLKKLATAIEKTSSISQNCSLRRDSIVKIIAERLGEEYLPKEPLFPPLTFGSYNRRFRGRR